MRSSSSLRLAAASVLVLIAAVSVHAQSATELARQALAECERGRRAAVKRERRQAFEHGEALARAAVAADDNNADAHFALFCNAGELTRIDGESVRAAFRVRGLLNELDRTLELNPRHLGALTAKGTMLLRLPRLLGGNPAEGEALLRRAIEVDPHAVTSRLTLAPILDARGEHAEARAEAERALAIAEEQGRADKVAEARRLLARLASDGQR